MDSNDEPFLALPWRSADVKNLQFAGKRVALEEGLGDVHRGAPSADDTVGAILWDGSAHLAQWLCDNASVVQGKTVLELGAGVGLVSIVAALLGASSCCATDMPHVLPLLSRNVASNGVAAQVCVTPFKWGVDRAPVTGVDVVLAADCVYSPQLVPVFVQALAQCLGPTSLAIVVSKVRSVALIRELEAAFVAHGCVWDALTGDAEHVEFVIHRVRTT